MSTTKKTIENISVVGIMKIIARLLNAITLIILARLLLPSDFGIVALAVLLMSVMDQFRNFGLSIAIIQRDEDVEESLKTGFTMTLIFSIVLSAVAFFLAPYWAAFYGDQNITLLVRIILIKFLLDSLNFIPDTKLTKNLKFKLAAVPDFLGRITYSVSAILLAYLGFSYWSLVYGRIIQSFVYFVSMKYLSPWKFELSFDKVIAKDLYYYGKYVFFTGIIFFLVSTLDNAVIGKIVGTVALGYYLIAYRWATFSMTEISNTISRVMFPTYSIMNNDLSKIKRAFLKTLKYTSMLSIPFMLGLFSIANEFVRILLGEKWAPAIIPLQILTLFGLLQSIGVSTGSVFYSIGKPKIPAILNTLNLILLVGFIVPVTRGYGIIGVAALVSSISLVLFPVNFFFLLKELKVGFEELGRTFLAPTVSALVMVFSIFLFKEIISRKSLLDASSLSYLVILVIFGVFVYLGTLFKFTKGKLKGDITLITSNLMKK